MHPDQATAVSRLGFRPRVRLRRGVWRPTAGGWTGLMLAVPLLVATGVLVAYPLARLFLLSLEGDGVGNYSAYFENAANLRVLRTTFIDSAIVTVLAVLFGSVVAWHLRTTRRRVVRAGLWLAVFVPLLMGTVVKNYAFVLLLGREGPVNDLLTGVGVVHEPIALLYTQAAVIAGIFYAMLPYAVLTLYVAFRTIDLDLMAAAESLGATRTQAMVSVVLPLALPAVVSAAVLVFVIAVGFYVTPVVLGGTTSPFAATFIDNALFQFNDTSGASTSSMVLILAAALIVASGVAAVGVERIRRAAG